MFIYKNKIKDSCDFSGNFKYIVIVIVSGEEITMRERTLMKKILTFILTLAMVLSNFTTPV